MPKRNTAQKVKSKKQGKSSFQYFLTGAAVLLSLLFTIATSAAAVLIGIEVHFNRQPGAPDNASVASLSVIAAFLLVVAAIALSLVFLAASFYDPKAALRLRLVVVVCVIVIAVGVVVGFAISQDSGCFRTCAPFPD